MNPKPTSAVATPTYYLSPNDSPTRHSDTLDDLAIRCSGEEPTAPDSAVDEEEELQKVTVSAAMPVLAYTQTMISPPPPGPCSKASSTAPHIQRPSHLNGENSNRRRNPPIQENSNRRHDPSEDENPNRERDPSEEENPNRRRDAESPPPTTRTGTTVRRRKRDRLKRFFRRLLFPIPSSKPRMKSLSSRKKSRSNPFYQTPNSSSTGSICQEPDRNASFSTLNSLERLEVEIEVKYVPHNSPAASMLTTCPGAGNAKQRWQQSTRLPRYLKAHSARH